MYKVEKKMKKKKKDKFYALYQGDELICSGTLEEIAKYQGVKVDTIKFYSYPVYRKRTKNGYVLIEVEE